MNMNGVEKYKDFRFRPKRWDRKLMGREYSDFLLCCLRSEAGKEVDDTIIFNENAPIDLVWQDLLLGLEAKRFDKTTFRNDGHAIAWIKQQFLERFIDYRKETGQNLKIGILCVTEKRWSIEVDNWLKAQGKYLIETGSINSIAERQIAEEAFIDQLTNILAEVCKNSNSILEVA